MTQENYSDIFLQFSLNPDYCSLVTGIKEETPNSHKNSTYYSRSLKLWMRKSKALKYLKNFFNIKFFPICVGKLETCWKLHWMYECALSPPSYGSSEHGGLGIIHTMFISSFLLGQNHKGMNKLSNGTKLEHIKEEIFLLN